MIEAYPLRWPKGRPRTPPQARQAAKFRTGFALAVRRVQHEARALGGHDPVVSTDLPLRPDGLPVAGTRGREPADPGAAAYFDWEGLRHCVACDRWQRVEDNVHAIALGLETLGRMVWLGGKHMLRPALRGYEVEVPRGGDAESWWRVLGVPYDAPLHVAESAYRKLATYAHPQRGGSADAMMRLHIAIREARLQLRQRDHG